jgi:hypothetical protein
VIPQFQSNRRKSREKKLHHLDFLAAMAFSKLFFLDANFAVIPSIQSNVTEISTQNQIQSTNTLSPSFDHEVEIDGHSSISRSDLRET